MIDDRFKYAMFSGDGDDPVVRLEMHNRSREVIIEDDGHGWIVKKIDENNDIESKRFPRCTHVLDMRDQFIDLFSWLEAAP